MRMKSGRRGGGSQTFRVAHIHMGLGVVPSMVTEVLLLIGFRFLIGSFFLRGGLASQKQAAKAGAGGGSSVPKRFPWSQERPG